jgi:hypothetical protein
VPFASRILGRQIFEVTRDVFAEITDVLNWTLTEDEQKAEWKKALAEHGIVSRETFVTFGIRKFAKTSFGNYGKGRAFATLMLVELDKYVREQTIDAICERLGWTMSEKELSEHWKRILRSHGIVSRKTLLDFTAKKFGKTSFGPYGKGLRFAYYILGQSEGICTVQVLEKVADKLGWIKDDAAEMASWKQALAEHGIISYTTLLDYGSTDFAKTKFGDHGKGFAFCTAMGILDQVVTNQTLHKVAVRLGWNYDPVNQIDEWIEVLKQNGITSRDQLLGLSLNTFLHMSFGRFGKGTAFTTTVLGTYERPSASTIEKIADKLGWFERTTEEKTIEWKEILKGHGIASRDDMLRKGVRVMSDLTFGMYGGIMSFSTAVIGSPQNAVNTELLEKIATKLGWSVSPEEEIGRWKQALAEHGITSRKELLRAGPVPFMKKSFGYYGKGSAFAGIILGVSTKVRSSVLEDIAKKLGWTPTEQELISEWKEELKLHGITSRETLCEYGQKRFKKLKFGDYGGGQAFAKTILGSLTEEHFTNDDLTRMADKLGW